MFFKYNSKLLIETISYILWHTEPNSRLVVKDGVLGVVGDVLGD